MKEQTIILLFFAALILGLIYVLLHPLPARADVLAPLTTADPVCTNHFGIEVSCKTLGIAPKPNTPTTTILTVQEQHASLAIPTPVQSTPVIATTTTATSTPTIAQLIAEIQKLQVLLKEFEAK